MGENGMRSAFRLKVAILFVPFILSAAWAGTDGLSSALPSPGTPAGQDAQPAETAPMEHLEPAVPDGRDGEQMSAPSSGIQPQTSPTATATPPIALPPGPERDEKDLFDTLHRSLSQGFLSTATWLDSFFGDERYEAESNRSQLKIRFDAFREDGTGMQYRDPILTLRLVLPQLRKMARLVITGDPNVEVDSTSSAPPGASSSQLQPSTGSRVTTALQYFPLETARSNLSLRAGVRLHQGRPGALIGPRYRLLIPLNPWDLRFTQEVIWSSENRWQSRTRFDLERPLPRDLFFRSTLEGLWSQNVSGYPYALSFLLRQPLDRDRALEYEWISSFQTSPANILVEELFVFRYRQRFWRDWLFLEIDPQFRYPRDRSFVFTPGILFRIEMVFGDIQRIF
jgi:hypothetical protein